MASFSASLYMSASRLAPNRTPTVANGTINYSRNRALEHVQQIGVNKTYDLLNLWYVCVASNAESTHDRRE
jgi:hypothetical protein